MYISVKLLNGFKESLLYKVPIDFDNKHLVVGSIVKVPLKNKILLSVIIKVLENLPENINFKIKEANSIEAFPKDVFYIKFIEQLAKYYGMEFSYFYVRLRSFLSEKEHIVDDLKKIDTTQKAVKILTNSQTNIVNNISPFIDQPIFKPNLIHGVTGSGKTEIYKQLIIKAFNCNKTTILLLPEVSLAVQFTNLLKQQLDNSINIFGFHSATSIKEKRELWNCLIQNKTSLIIGVHLPILLPISNLGLIIIDEEHDNGFQEKKHPKINTKEAALIRAQNYGIPIVLGSATPAISTIYNATKRNWNIFQLKDRYAGSFPKIKFVKLTENIKRKNFWISTELQHAMQDRLLKKEQTIIFINRRGYSFFIQCKNCGHIENCQSCSVSLTLHEDQTLKCHYCDFKKENIKACPTCKSGESALLKKGIGTQQVVTILEKLFPQAVIARADLDATINKKKWSQIIKDFEEKKIDILVGTQTITKGYHFPGVTLVGILWADINLSFPVYNAAESTLQQLIQVAGRSGRQSLESLVIVQSMIEHPIFKYLNEVDYYDFYKHEIANRQAVLYPPCVRLSEIELKHQDESIVDFEANKLADFFIKLINDKKLNLTLLGPAIPPVAKIKNISSRKIYIKSQDNIQALKLYKNIPNELYKSSIFFTPNPLN